MCRVNYVKYLHIQSKHMIVYANEASKDGSDWMCVLWKIRERERERKMCATKNENENENKIPKRPLTLVLFVYALRTRIHTHKYTNHVCDIFHCGFHLISHSWNLEKYTTLYYHFTHKCQFLIQPCSQRIK